MFSNSESELQAEVRLRSSAVKRDIQCACDAAFLRLRDKERQLLRVVDLVSSRQQGDLWAASLLRRQYEERGGQGQLPPLPAVQTMSLSVDSELLSRAVHQFATVHLDGVMTAPAGGSSASLPDRLEEYGAEEHLVSHKPLPNVPGFVRVTRPPSLAGYSQLSGASSLTSGGEDEKFELIDSMIPEKIFRSDPIDIDKSRCGCVRRPTLDIENLNSMDCVSGTSPNSDNRDGEDTGRDGENTGCDGENTGRDGEKTDSGPGEKLTASVRHPLQESDEAWLLPSAGTRRNSAVPSPFAQWEALMSSTSLYTPASTVSPTTASTMSPTTSPTTAPASSPAASVAERRRWLLPQACRANEPCQTPADCVSDCAEAVERMVLRDWRSQWLLGGGSGSSAGLRSDVGSSGGVGSCDDGKRGSGTFDGFRAGSIDVGNNSGSCGGGFSPAIEEEEEMKVASEESGTVPDLLAPFRQFEKNTSWVATRG